MRGVVANLGFLISLGIARELMLLSNQL
uniref:Uncharacterized protein n=1 Tax=Arundo donax TaxID=35708 RepID=A0A0A9FK13_ARUDO